MQCERAAADFQFIIHFARAENQGDSMLFLHSLAAPFGFN